MKHCPQCSTGYPDSLAACPTHGLPLNEIRDLKPGMVIHHSYRIVRKLGQGGMGAVYLAQHTLMDEPRALKFLSAELSQDQAFTARFLREVRTLRQIRHPNVVDCGDLESAEDGSLFFSMEFVDGPDLRAFLRDAKGTGVKGTGVKGTGFNPYIKAQNEAGPLGPEGALPVALALALTRQIAQGLAAAHARGMVHRDIKPENILLARDGPGWQPKIADFGIVATKESSSVFTRTGGTLLTVAYAAPEQWRGTPAAELDGRTDLYALGGLLYEMLTGQTAFQAESYEGWAHQHQTTPPPPPSALRPDLANWQGLDALVQRLLAKDREDRPKDVAELVRLLDAVQYLPPDARRQTFKETDVQEGVKRSRRGPRWAWIPLIVLMGLLIVITGFFFGLPVSNIAKCADDFDKAQHYDLGGIMRNFACMRGDFQSCSDLGKMFEYGGVGVPRDTPRALNLNTKACDGGIADSCVYLGYMYEGLGVSGTIMHNISLAETLYTKACEAGSSRGCGNLVRRALHYESPFNNDAPNYPEAVSLYSTACDVGDANGCENLGMMYTRGHGVERDYSQAYDLFSKACAEGDAPGCFELGLLYWRGNGVKKDIGKARQYWSEGCSLGSQAGCNALQKIQ
jgi:serine/threonine protein kinase/TPR repeat protein